MRNKHFLNFARGSSQFLMHVLNVCMITICLGRETYEALYIIYVTVITLHWLTGLLPAAVEDNDVQMIV